MQANFPCTIKFYFFYSLTAALNPLRIQKSRYNIRKKIKVVANHNLLSEQHSRRSVNIKYPQPMCTYSLFLGESKQNTAFRDTHLVAFA
jgi:hypothetical protein